MLIDTSYFLNKSVFIPSVVEHPSIGTFTPSKNEALTNFIGEKEYQLLVNTLGFQQYAELSQQLETDGTFKPDALQKWKDLVDGKGSWLGLRYKIGNNKVSLIAYYVYFYWLGQDYLTYTTEGIQQQEAANSITIAPNNRQVNAWNEFVKRYGGYYNQQRLNYSFFRNWNGLGMQWGNNKLNGNDVTLYDFMQANADVYDMSFFIPETPLNPYGL